MTPSIKNRLRFLYDRNERAENKVIKRLISEGNLDTSIYHVHIRKTAGTTINHAFLSTCNPGNVGQFYRSLGRKHNHRLIKNDKVFVGWNKYLIDQGKYFYGFSHIPLHQLHLPPNVLKITCLRDPIKRVLSHYNMLRYFQVNNIDHSCMKTEGKWLGSSFHDFLDRISKKHLLNQLFMFSKNYSVHEASENILSLYYCLFTENLENGLRELENKLQLKLPIAHEKKYGYKEDIPKDAMERLQEMMDDEYKMINIIKQGKS